MYNLSLERKPRVRVKMIEDFNKKIHDKGEDTTLGYSIILLGQDFQHWLGKK